MSKADCRPERKTNVELREWYFSKLRDDGDAMSSTEYAATCRAWHIFSLKSRWEKEPMPKFEHGCTITMRSSGDKD